jgi:hypothetical protein
MGMFNIMEEKKMDKYFYGQKISEYGKQYNRVDYHALAAAFDAVLCNDITKLFYGSVNGEYSEVEQVNGFIDNSELIETKQDQIETLEYTRDNSDDIEQINYINDQIDIINSQIEELEQEQEEQPEIFQYYIISDSGYNILKYHTDEIVYYIESLDIYIWGVTHFGTSWDYVLTNIMIEEDPEQ